LRGRFAVAEGVGKEGVGKEGEGREGERGGNVEGSRKWSAPGPTLALGGPGHGPSIQLGADTVPACDHVQLLGVFISADVSLDRHVSVVSLASFYWLRQLRRVRRSLDDESAAILFHAFVTSRFGYCNLLLAGAPKSVTDKLQRVMNAAARVVSGTN